MNAKRWITRPALAMVALEQQKRSKFFGTACNASQDLTLDCDAKDLDLCDCLVQVLEHSNLRTLTVTGVEGLTTLFNALRACTTTTTKLRELFLQ